MIPTRQYYDGNPARPTPSYTYDANAAIRPQNTMPVRQKPKKPYDANFMRNYDAK